MCGVDDMDLEEEGIGRVEAVEVDALDENDGPYEATIWRVGIAFIGDREGEIERTDKCGDVAIYYLKRMANRARREGRTISA